MRGQMYPGAANGPRCSAPNQFDKGIEIAGGCLPCSASLVPCEPNNRTQARLRRTRRRCDEHDERDKREERDEDVACAPYGVPADDTSTSGPSNDRAGPGHVLVSGARLVCSCAHRAGRVPVGSGLAASGLGTRLCSAPHSAPPQMHARAFIGELASSPVLASCHSEVEQKPAENHQPLLTAQIFQDVAALRLANIIARR